MDAASFARYRVLRRYRQKSQTRSGLSAQQHYLVPTVYVRLPHRIRFKLGVGFGLTSSSDGVISKFQVEYDWLGL